MRTQLKEAFERAAWDISRARIVWTSPRKARGFRGCLSKDSNGKFVIEIREGMEAEETYTTLLHELAHTFQKNLSLYHGSFEERETRRAASPPKQAANDPWELHLQPFLKEMRNNVYYKCALSNRGKYEDMFFRLAMLSELYSGNGC